MSLENIVEKILSEAASTVKVIDGKAEEDVERLRTRLDADQRELDEDAKKRSEDEAEEIVRRQTSSARLEGRKRVLAAKESIINEVFAEAKAKLHGLPDDEYLKLLSGLAVNHCASGDEIIMLSPSDNKRLSKKLKTWTSSINAALKEKKLPGKVDVSNETRNIEGGIVLSKGRTEINLSLDVLLGELRYELEGRLTEILFPES
ncbi:MAG: V-type ATP synthase subunit E [Deltaproteobacteria bacterium]|nr:V-type ATP synthase subunit E [Candidatus Zymogenaceae bacterium]